METRRRRHSPSSRLVAHAFGVPLRAALFLLGLSPGEPPGPARLLKMAKILGDNTIYDTSRKFGFGMTSGIRLPGETPGKLRTLKQWSSISGRMVSIGQEISSSTLQIAMAYSTIANGGFLVKPYIVKSAGDSNMDNDYPE